MLFVNPDLIHSIESSIEEELKYCDFYDEYLQKQANDSNFNRWVLIAQKDIPDLYGWKKAPGEQWVRTNGRVKAIIQFDRSSAMVKLTLEYDNASSALHFYEKPYKFTIPVVHLKNAQKIEEAVEQFKQEADRFLFDHLFPAGAKTDFDCLELLLHIEK